MNLNLNQTLTLLRRLGGREFQTDGHHSRTINFSKLRLCEFPSLFTSHVLGESQSGNLTRGLT